MNQDRATAAELTELNGRLNELLERFDGSYHQASSQLGLSDTEFRILYYLHLHNGCPQRDIWHNNLLPRQTVNSAIRKLADTGIVYTQAHSKRDVRVFLTDDGRQLIARTVEPIFQAECRALGALGREDSEQLLTLLNRYASALHEELTNLNPHDSTVTQTTDH